MIRQSTPYNKVYMLLQSLGLFLVSFFPTLSHVGLFRSTEIAKSFLPVGLTLLMIACTPSQPPDFSTQLKEKLNAALENFQPSNKAFILNVLTPQKKTVFQIIHTSYAQQTRRENDRFGFALHLTFPAHQGRAHERFKSMKYFSDFKFYKYEDVPCYVIDLDKDVEKSVSLSQRILNEVYEFKTLDKFSIEMTDEGNVENWLQ